MAEVKVEIKVGLRVDLGKGGVQESTQAEVGRGQVGCGVENTHLCGTSEADRDGPWLLN